MNGHASPATRLHDVVVVHDQSGRAWQAGAAEIRGGRIVVRAGPAAPEAAFFANPVATYSIAATDGANRARRFPNVVLARADSRPPEEYVFD